MTDGIGIKNETVIGTPSLQTIAKRTETMKASDDRNCSMCAFYALNPAEQDLRARNAKAGFCLRYPPQHGFHVLADGRILEKSSFPHVNMTNVCGEYLG